MGIGILCPISDYGTIHGLIKMEDILISNAYTAADIQICPVNTRKLRRNCISSIEILGANSRVPKEVFQTRWCNQFCTGYSKTICEGNNNSLAISTPPGLINCSIDVVACRDQPHICISSSINKKGCIHLFRETEE